MSEIVDYHVHSDGRVDILVEINGELFQGQLEPTEGR
jgi:hypothetical protein